MSAVITCKRESHSPWQVGREDEFSISRQQMAARIAVCMGGTVAEELVFGRENVRGGWIYLSFLALWSSLSTGLHGCRLSPMYNALSH